VNDALVDAPEIMNSDPYGDAWIIKFKASDSAEFDQLMSPEDYEKYAQEEE